MKILKKICKSYHITYDQLYIKYNPKNGLHAYCNIAEYKEIYCEQVYIKYSFKKNQIHIKDANLSFSLNNQNKNNIFNDIQIDRCNIKIKKDNTVYYIYNIKLHIYNKSIYIFDEKDRSLFAYNGNNCYIHKDLTLHIPSLIYQIEGNINDINGQCNGFLTIINPKKTQIEVNINNNLFNIKYHKNDIKGKLIHKHNKAYQLSIDQMKNLKDDLWPSIYQNEGKSFLPKIKSLDICNLTVNLDNDFHINCKYKMSFHLNEILKFNNVIGSFNMQNSIKSIDFKWKNISGIINIHQSFLLKAKGTAKITDLYQNHNLQCHHQFPIKITINNKYFGDKTNHMEIETTLDNINLEYYKQKLDNLNGKIKIQKQNDKYNLDCNVKCDVNDSEFTVNAKKNKITIKSNNLYIPSLNYFISSKNKLLSSTYEGILKHNTLSGILKIDSDSASGNIKHNNNNFTINTDLIDGNMSIDRFRIDTCNLNIDKMKLLIQNDLKASISGIVRKEYFNKNSNNNQYLKLHDLISPIKNGIYNLNIALKYMNHTLNGNAQIKSDKYLSIDSINCFGTLGSIKKMNDQYYIKSNNFQVLDEEHIYAGILDMRYRIDDDYHISGAIDLTNLSLKRQKSSQSLKNILSKTLLLFFSPTLSFQSSIGRKISVPSTKMKFTYEAPLLTVHNMRSNDWMKSFSATGYLNLKDRSIDIAGNISPLYFINSLIKKIPILKHFGKRDTLFNKNIYITGSIENPTIQLFKRKIQRHK